MNDSANFGGREVTVVCAADDLYALPLAVSIRSALDTLDPERTLRLLVLDGGLSARSRKRCLESWRHPGFRVEWISPERSAIADLRGSHHVTSSCYLRLLMDRLLPEDAGRVIYLDVDVVVRQDLGRLLDVPFGDWIALAVPDAGAPRLDAEIGLPSYHRCAAFLVTTRPVPNYRELGLDPAGAYFNSGLMVIDVDRWRRSQIGPRCLDVLRRHKQHVVWWDQYALNVVLAGHWGELDPRWNQGAHVYAYPDWSESPYDRETFDRLRRDPWIIHYCSPAKPWHHGCAHPLAGEFRAVVNRTAWRGWRPPAPASSWRAWWGVLAGHPAIDHLVRLPRGWLKSPRGRSGLARREGVPSRRAVVLHAAAHSAAAGSSISFTEKSS